MKRFHSFLAAALATSVICSGTFADEPSDKIGGGRLLRKWRDDLFGKSEDQKPQQPTAQDPRHQPTPAQPRAAYGTQPNSPAFSPNSPQSAVRKPANVVRSLTQPPSQQQPGANAPAPARANHHTMNPLSMFNRSANSAGEPATPPSQSPAQAPHVAKLRGAPVDGFGMEINAGKDEKFYIVSIDPRGNAAKAGVHRGDEVLQVGGSNLTTLEELDQIAKILGAGDQLEFKISRRGQTKDFMIQYGEALELPVSKETENKGLPFAPDRSAAADLTSRGLAQPAAAGRYDFVPQPSANGYQSVLDMERSTQQSNLTPARPPRQNGNVSRPVNRQVGHPIVDPSLTAPSVQAASPKNTGSSILEELSLD